MAVLLGKAHWGGGGWPETFTLVPKFYCAAQPPWALSKNYGPIHHEGPGLCRMDPGTSSGKDTSSFEAVNGAIFSVLLIPEH